MVYGLEFICHFKFLVFIPPILAKEFICIKKYGILQSNIIHFFNHLFTTNSVLPCHKAVGTVECTDDFHPLTCRRAVLLFCSHVDV